MPRSAKRKKVNSASTTSDTTSSKKPKTGTTTLSKAPLHFIVDNAIAKSCVFNFFKFSSNPLFTVGVDPFETLSKTPKANLYISFCTNHLGPLDTSSFAHTLCLRFGAKQDLENIIMNKYFGEIPPNSLLSAKISTDSELVFIIIDPEDSLAYYNATRVALLYVMDKSFNEPYSDRLRSVTSNTLTDKPTPKKLSIPSVFQETGKVASQTSVLTRSRRVSTGNRTRVSFSVSSSTDPIIQEHIVWQMSKAYNGLLSNPKKLLSPEDLATKLNRIRTPNPKSEQNLKKLFCEYAKRNELIRRGILNEKEVDWLLEWLVNGTSVPMQLAAATSLGHYIQSEKPTLPIDLSRKFVLDILFKKEKSLGTMLDLAADGLVSLHRNIESNEVTKSDLIGQGGTAAVYKATFNNTLVAYKEFSDGIKKEELLREVAMMSLLRHPCLVNMIGAGTSEVKPFLVMELLSKGDLYHILHESSDKSPLSESTIISWATDIACGMQFLHSLGIIHRDLKSLNILVSQDDRCKIIDYGASRVAVDDKMTGNIGTISWMAPEMFQGGNYSEKIDVYSFAIVLYELVTRQIPYDGEHAFGVPVQVVKGVRPKLPKNVPKKWIKLLQQCWHEKPSKRPTFDKILASLQSIQSN